LEYQKVRNQNGMNNEKKIMDKKVRIIFFSYFHYVYGLLDKLVLEFIIYFSILSKWLVQDDLENSP